MDAVTLTNIRFQYPNTDQVILDDVSLGFPQGEWTTIIGHNGSGKSTLARLIDGLLMPQQGQITVGSVPVTEENMTKVHQQVGIVFQNPDNQFVGATVADDVAFGLENRQVPRDEMQARIQQSLAAVDMAQLADAEPAMLSGGQKQRVAIAGILAMQCDCIVLDEPTAMLDPIGRREVMDTIRQLNAEGITVIIITHFMEEAVQTGRVIVIQNGELKMDGTPRSVFTKVDALKSMGLDVPAASELAFKLREKGIPLPGNIITKEELGDALCQLG